MSTDGDASDRLASALDQIFSRSRDDAREELPRDHGGDIEAAPADAAATNADAGVSGEPSVVPVGEPTDVPIDTGDEPFELPGIVPATEPPAPVAPTLPARAIRPEPASAASPTLRTDVTPAVAPTSSAAPTKPARAAAPPSAAAKASPATGWSDHMGAAPTPNAPMRTAGRRPRVRRVTRVLRHVDPWSTFKVALLFSLVTYLVALTSGVLLWQVADSTGTLDNVERWFTQFGWETFELKGGEIFHNAWIIGLFGAVAMTGGLVLLATVFNLVSDIIGGVRVTVLEEEVVERTITSTRRYVVRQGPAAGGAAPAPAWSVDDDEAADSADQAHADQADADQADADQADAAAGEDGPSPTNGDHPDRPDAEPTRPVPTVIEPGADWSVDDD